MAGVVLGPEDVRVNKRQDHCTQQSCSPKGKAMNRTKLFPLTT